MKSSTRRSKLTGFRSTPIKPNPKFFCQLRRSNAVKKEKVVIVLGSTGTGKSKLSINLAARFPAEIINSDKMQVYEGLDIITNKVSEEEQCGVAHHLLGVVNRNADFTAANFCDTAMLAIESITARGHFPIIAGGSNSFVEALVERYSFKSKYDCCFLWVDVLMPTLHSFVSKRVDSMIDMGMVNEARNIFSSEADYTRGIRRAIGVPEFDRYFRAESSAARHDRETSEKLLQDAVREIKDNTRKLACRQFDKICRLQNLKGWNMHRIDATTVFRKRGREAEEAWEKLVLAPSTMIIEQFLRNNPSSSPILHPPQPRIIFKEQVAVKFRDFSKCEVLRVE